MRELRDRPDMDQLRRQARRFAAPPPPNRSLHERQGYARRNPMTRRLLPLPGRAREALLRRIANSAGGQGG